MPYNSLGQYTPVGGAETAAPGGTIASATWNSINTDYQTSLSYIIGGVVAVARQVTFSANSVDFQLPVNLPTGFSRFRAALCEISNPSGALNTSNVALFTAAAGGGTQIVTSTAVTITTATGNTNNNAQTLTPGQVSTIAVSTSAVFFRVMVGTSVAGSTADVLLIAQPVS